MYLRYLPPWRLRQLARNLSTDFVWTYCHPYDFATGEAFGRVADRGVLASLFLWCNRGATLGRMAALMHGRRSVPFAERLAGLDPPTFVPPQSRRPV